MFYLTHLLKPLARSVGRRNRSAIARHVMKDSRVRKKIVEHMGKLLSKELARLSSKKVNSHFRDVSVSALEEFTWESLLQEIGTEAPVMLSFLRECVHVKRRGHQPKGKGGRSARRLPSEDTAIAMCFAVLLRARSLRMNLVQRMISTLLYASHAPKQVWSIIMHLASY